MIRALIGCAMLLPGTAAMADPRIATRLFQPSEIVTINGKAGVESAVSFADDERIENIAVGDSAIWQVTPNKRANLVFLKPAVTGKHSNMTVVTDRRTYLFDLVARPGVQPIYMLRFTYPQPPRPSAPAAAPPAGATTAVATPKPAADLDPATLNFAWDRKGDKALLPERVFDDGKATYLAWGKDAALPAILTREANGTEGPVNYTVRGIFVVVDGTPGPLVLRAGRQVATLAPAASAGPPTSRNPRERSFAGGRTLHLADIRR